MNKRRKGNVSPMKHAICFGILMLCVLFGCSGNSIAGAVNFDLPMEITQATITVDGLASDWQGIVPVVTDLQGDCSVGTGCDIKEVYVAYDNDYVYWRMDSYDGYDFTPHGSFPDEHSPGWTIGFAQNPDPTYVNEALWADGDIEARAWNRGGGFIWVRNGQRIDGEAYGVIGEVAEGKIPIELFRSITVKSIGSYFYAGEDGSAGDATEVLYNKSVTTPEVRVLSGSSGEILTVPSGGNILAYGTSGNDEIIVQKNGKIRLLHALGENTIRIQVPAAECEVFRSGAMITIKDKGNTSVKMPATSTVQTIEFSDGSRYPLQIRDKKVMLKDQVVTLSSSAITATEPESGEHQPGELMTVDLGNGVKMEFVWIPKGSFMMGSPDDDPDADGDEFPQHKVTFTKGFWMGKYEVTQGQWKAVMVNNPSYFQGEKAPAGENTDNLPVEQCSWDDVQEFIAKLNGITDGKYALPSEAQWEYAARGGVQNHTYSGSNNIDEVAWYRLNNGKMTPHEVGKKKANAYGLHDMTGNVDELCQDFWHDDYIGAPADGSAWDYDNSVQLLVGRGGSWNNYPDHQYVADREHFYPVLFRYWALGFRLVRLP